MKIVLAITGASGLIYARRFLEHFDYGRDSLDAVLSGSARTYQELEAETPLDWSRYGATLWEDKDFRAPFASGSAKYDGLVILPCSAGTLGRVASGISDNLITRAADVFLKERRKLVLVLRENPLSLVHLENMKTLAQAGASVMTACPHFYGGPKTLDDLADTVVARVYDQLGLAASFAYRWNQNDKE